MWSEPGHGGRAAGDGRDHGACGALALNMGTPGERREQAMLAAGKAANGNGIPVVLDPVGVGASAFRRKMAEELLEAVTFTAIRGNMSEIRTLSELAERR